MFLPAILLHFRILVILVFHCCQFSLVVTELAHKKQLILLSCLHAWFLHECLGTYDALFTLLPFGTANAMAIGSLTFFVVLDCEQCLFFCEIQLE